MPMKWEHTYPGLFEGNQGVRVENYVLEAIPEDLTGKTVLDLGAWDGYYSYIAASRGAKYVLSVDNGEGEIRVFKSSIENLCEKYRMVKAATKTDLNFVPLDAFDIDKIQMKFDVIFCLGLFYHVKDIYGLFEKIYDRLNDGGLLIVEGAIVCFSNAVIYINAEGELDGDSTNVWCPTEEGISKMLKRIGFVDYDIKGAGFGWEKYRRILFTIKKGVIK